MVSLPFSAYVIFTLLCGNRFVRSESPSENIPAAQSEQTLSDKSQNTFCDKTSLLDGLSGDEFCQLSNASNSHNFLTEQDRIMKLIINSLYKNKEIFLRELISNGYDAIEKVRKDYLINRQEVAESTLSIRIKVDTDKNMIHITDSGIGMTAEHLRSYLGTIAKSQTSEFLKTLEDENASQDPNAVGDLIGQFGVGFYSAFLVADQVIVTSKHDDDDQYIWKSDSKQFHITKDPRGNTLNRGTTVSLHLKEEAIEYLDLLTLRKIIVKYSQLVRVPIYLWNHKEVEEDEDIEDISKDEEPKKVADDEVDSSKTGEDVNISDDDEQKEQKKTTKKAKHEVWYWDHVNDIKPICQRRPSEVDKEEYIEFYKALVNRNETPLTHLHFAAEGDVNFRSLLYIPASAPPNYMSSLNNANRDNIKLYVRRVFISEQSDLLPSYLNFVLGIVDSDDFTLNISREELQQNKILKTIRKKLIRKIIEALKNLNETEYTGFWKEFGTNIKFGVVEDSLNRIRLAKLLRFYSSYSTMDGRENFTTLGDYVKRAQKDQKSIYYVAERSIGEARKSPFAEKLMKKGYEVLYLVDPLDQHCLQNIPEFEKMKFQNAAKEGLDIKTSKNAKKQLEKLEKDYQPLIQWMEEAFSDKIIKVLLSDRLVETPMVFIAAKWGYDGNMERISRAQAFQRVGGDTATVHFANMKRKMEINPKHPLIKDLLRRVKSDRSDPQLRELAEICVDMAMMRSGYELRDPLKFTDRIEAVLREVMHIPPKQSTQIYDDIDADEIEEEIADEEDQSIDNVSDDGVNNDKNSLNQREKRSVRLTSKKGDKIRKSKSTLPLKKKGEKIRKSKSTLPVKHRAKRTRKGCQLHNVQYDKIKRRNPSDKLDKKKRGLKNNRKNGCHNENQVIKKSIDNNSLTHHKLERNPDTYGVPVNKHYKRNANKSKQGKQLKTRGNSNRQRSKSPESIDLVLGDNHNTKKEFYKDDKVQTKVKNENVVKGLTWQNKIYRLLLNIWRYLCSASNSEDYDMSNTNVNKHFSGGFVMAAEQKRTNNFKLPSENKISSRQNYPDNNDTNLPLGVYLKNGKLHVGYQYRYRLSKFLKSSEGKTWAQQINYSESTLGNVAATTDYDDNADRYLIRKPAVGYAYRYRISNYLKTLNEKEIDDLHEQGYLRPIIKHESKTSSLPPYVDKSSNMVITYIWQTLSNLLSYNICVEYAQDDGDNIDKKINQDVKRNPLTGKIGYEFRYRLSKKIEALNRQHDEAEKLQVKPLNVSYAYRYRISKMLKLLNITYQEMVAMINNGSWKKYRQDKESVLFQSQATAHPKNAVSVEDQIENLKLVGNPEISKIHIDIKDLYPPELISVGYGFRYRRSRKMAALNISKKVVEQRRWKVLERKFKENTIRLLDKVKLANNNQLKSFGNKSLAKDSDGGFIFMLDYSKLTPEEKRVGYKYRYRISRKYQTHIPKYILEYVDNGKPEKLDVKKIFSEVQNRKKSKDRCCEKATIDKSITDNKYYSLLCAEVKHTMNLNKAKVLSETSVKKNEKGDNAKPLKERQNKTVKIGISSSKKKRLTSQQKVKSDKIIEKNHAKLKRNRKISDRNNEPDMNVTYSNNLQYTDDRRKEEKENKEIITDENILHASDNYLYDDVKNQIIKDVPISENENLCDLQINDDDISKSASSVKTENEATNDKTKHEFYGDSNRHSANNEGSDENVINIKNVSFIKLTRIWLKSLRDEMFNLIM